MLANGEGGILAEDVVFVLRPSMFGCADLRGLCFGKKMYCVANAMNYDGGKASFSENVLEKEIALYQGELFKW